MLDSILLQAAATGLVNPVGFWQIAICIGASLVMGLVIALVHMYRNHYTKSFIVTLVLLPALVQAVIMLVNGNLGVGVAVMGAFGLIRFRSVPGSSRELASIFFAMAVGLATGMGFVVYAALFTLVIALAMLLLNSLRFGENSRTKSLSITIPEDLDYVGLFDDLFALYTKAIKLDKVQTTNLGSLYELRYTVLQKDDALEKEFLDKIRQRNGNLTIALGSVAYGKDEL